MENELNLELPDIEAETCSCWARFALDITDKGVVWTCTDCKKKYRDPELDDYIGSLNNG